MRPRHKAAEIILRQGLITTMNPSFNEAAA